MSDRHHHDGTAVPLSVLDHIHEGCQVFGHDWRYLYINQAAARHGRKTVAELLGRTIHEGYPHIEATPIFAAMQRCMASRVADHVESEFPFADGSVGWFDIHIQPVPQGILVLSIEITAQKRAEMELRRSDETYRSLLRTIDDIVYAVNEAGVLTYVSPACERFGFEPAELIGKPLHTIVAADDRQKLDTMLARVASGLASLAEFHIVGRRGSRFVVSASCCAADPGSALRGYMGVLSDITDRRRVEEQLRLSQRLESVGRLAGGIAHDFNNLLSAILAYTGFCIDATPEGSPIRSDLEEIRGAGNRAVKLIRQLLAFSRRQVLQPEVLKLNSAIAEMQGILARTLGEDVRIRMRLSPDLWNARVDRGQLEQVLMNLCVNARDAMSTGGTLTIETSNAEVDAEFCRSHVTMSPGPYVILAVSDTGTGMTAEVKARLFEPFFTTKPAGKGTGLGLPTVFGIVKQSGGSIWVYSELGKGTTFRIYFPRTTDSTDHGRRETPTPVRAAGGETILLVEDEPPVREVARRILTTAGYGVITAADGHEAMAAFESATAPISLVLTDVIMPGMNGRALTERLRGMNPGLRVLFMSGYSNDVISEKGVLLPGAAFLEKPFTAAALTQKVRDVLGMPAPG